MVGKSSQDKHSGATHGNVRKLIFRTRVLPSEEGQKLYAADTGDNRKEQTNPNLKEWEHLTC